jgi:hypothetical protein
LDAPLGVLNAAAPASKTLFKYHFVTLIFIPQVVSYFLSTFLEPMGFEKSKTIKNIK